MNPFTAYSVSIVSTALASWAGAAASIQSATFYSMLVKPSRTPKAVVAGPLWSVLYVLIAVAEGLALQSVQPPRLAGVVAPSLVKLALNGLWTWAFFAWRFGAWSFVVIATLCLLVAATVAAFWKLVPMAGLLLVPYLAWIMFASA